MRDAFRAVVLVLILASLGGAAQKDSAAGRDKRRKKTPRTITQPVPAEDPATEPAPVAPAEPKPPTPPTEEEQAKLFQQKFAWRKGLIQVPAEFQKRSLDSPPAIAPPLEDLPKRGLGNEMAELRKGPDVAPVRLEKQIDFGAGEASALALSPDGSLLVVGTTKGVVTVWDVATAKKVCELARSSNAAVRAVCLSPDGRHVAVGTKAEHVRVFDAKTGRQKFQHEFFHADVRTLSLSHDGQWLFGMDGDGRVGGFPLLGGAGFVLGEEGISKPAGLFLAVPRKGKSIAFGGDNSETIWTAGLSQYVVKDGDRFGSMQPTAAPRKRLGVCGAASDHSVVLATADAELTVLRFYQPQDAASAIPRFLSRRILIQTGFCHRCALTPDDRYVLALSHTQGLLEIRPMEALQDVAVLSLPMKNVKVSAISDDARTIALSAGEGAVSVCRLDRFPDFARLRFARIVRGHLERKNYARLDALAERLAKRKEPFDWAPHEAAYDLFLDAALSEREPLRVKPDDTATQRVAAWHEARPDSVAARIAVADAEMQTAWAYRGSGYADTITEEGGRKFVEHVSKAHAALEGIPQNSGLPPSYYRHRLSQLQAVGWTEEEVESLEERLMKEWPEYLPAHHSLVFSQLARWYGETDADAEKYARRVADKIGGERGDALYARLAANLSRVFKREEFFTKSGFDSDRVQKGLQGLMDGHPDELLYRNLALRMAWFKDDRETAAKLFDGFTPADWRPGAWTYTQYKQARDWVKR